MRLLDELAGDEASLHTTVFVLIAVALLAVTVIIPRLFFDLPEARQDLGHTERATVRRILEERTQTGPRGPETYQRLEIEVGGQLYVIERTDVARDAQRIEVNAGDRVLVTSTPGEDPGQETYFIVDHVRQSSLALFVAAFCLLVVIVGRWQGALSLLGMAASLLVILRFVVPGILSGADPVAISVIGAFVILATSLYLSHGINRKTTTAFMGTAISLTLTAVLASLGVAIAKLTGLADEQAATLNIISAGDINPQGLLLAGIVIGALGVLDDVTVAQASAVFELKAANPLLRARELFRRAMNIGRDHIASTVNTLFLAYAGASLPLLILFSFQTEGPGILLNREFIAVEVIRTMVGSIAIVASVPLTTALAAWSLEFLPGDDSERLLS